MSSAETLDDGSQRSFYNLEARALELLNNSPVWPEDAIRSADEQIHFAAERIREFYFKNLELIRMLPYLALEANGRGGWDDSFSTAYNNCVMPLHSTGGYYDMYLDLRTGVILSTKGGNDKYLVQRTEKAELTLADSFCVASDEMVFSCFAHLFPYEEDRELGPAATARYMLGYLKRAYHNAPEAVEKWFKSKVWYKEQLDLIMQALPAEQVMEWARGKGYEVWGRG